MTRGRPVVGELGELVVTGPMPSMPTYFWNDPDGSRYHDAYFSRFEGVWRHGDWIEFTERGSVIVSGRSDATLNKAGVGWARRYLRDRRSAGGSRGQSRHRS